MLRGKAAFQRDLNRTEQFADRTFMKSKKDKWEALHMEQNNHLHGIQAGNAIHESATYPGSIQEHSH